MFLQLLAQAEDYTTTLPDTTTATDAAAAATSVGVFGALMGGLFIFWIIFGLLSLIFFIWWIVLIIDLSKRDFPQKTTYLVLMIIALFVPFMIVIMDLVYYFGVVKKGTGSTASPSVPAK